MLDNSIHYFSPQNPVFLNQERRIFSENLRPGDELLTSTGGAVLIKDIQTGYGKFTVHNLKLKDNHTYYADGILVHNCDLEAELAARIARRAESLNAPLVIATTVALPAAVEIVAPAVLVPAAALAINGLVCNAVRDEAADKIHYRTIPGIKILRGPPMGNPLVKVEDSLTLLSIMQVKQFQFLKAHKVQPLPQEVRVWIIEEDLVVMV
jgi:hypothetical protein